MSEGIWEQLEPLLTSVERPSRYCDHEWGTILNTEADYRCALIYPDTYEIGQSNQGLAILYRILNADTSIAAERAYVPWVDMAGIMRERGIPLFSLETYTPLSEFDLLGFTLPHELACTNVLEALDLARLPLLAGERDEYCPLIIAGGPCVYNPEPFVPFFDAFVIGEGEDVILEIVSTHRRLRDENATREEILLALAHIDGIYVPRFYEEREGVVVPLIPDLPAVIYKRVMRDFAERPADIEQIVPFAEVTHDRFTVEVLRGCSRGCRFCQAGMTYRPVRERTSDSVVSAVIQGLACTGYDEASLTSLSTTDHSQIEDILHRLNRRLESTGISISIPSQRVDAFGVDIAQLVAGEKKGGLTFAPEAGTQRLRDIINKNITEEDLLTAISSAFSA
ncbi:MAG: radical SAM protein, partial [Actinobacteria bacterium]|nr:radical SAM protein [Actinomycetota bacterium]